MKVLSQAPCHYPAVRPLLHFCQKIAGYQKFMSLDFGLKILSSALANRLREAMERSYGAVYSVPMPGRSIVDCVYLIWDVLEFSGTLWINTGLVSLDRRLSTWSTRCSGKWCLVRFGFSPCFTAMICVLYSGSLCAPFMVYRGIRQGCP